ncbi:hypothetical protein BGW80DRAFT_1333885 [Lactifluus volemus]|nr:hypothetical protein BGW80DRAFT_1333885 [Lactifluus volemus]
MVTNRRFARRPGDFLVLLPAAATHCGIGSTSTLLLWWLVLVLLLPFGIAHRYFCTFTRRLSMRILLLRYPHFP